MPIKVDIRESDGWRCNTAYRIKFRAWEDDGVTPREVTGYAFSWMLKRRLGDADASAFLTKTSTIVITGVFNLDPDVNTQLVEVPITAADTNTAALMPGGAFLHELKRTDTGLQTVMCQGSAVLKGSLHKAA